ncbi:MAG: T9SS type B sorting domain-containing protein [Bacteroidetes bacterium]|nr:T9SS type B sorting domain-containing protein [Bacteroidota bacterium]
MNGIVAKSISTDILYVTDSLSDGDIVTVEVFDTVTGCSAVSSGITNTVPPVLIITPTADVTLLCYGDSTATGTFTASGGTAPYVLFTADVNTAGASMGIASATDISFTNGGAGEVTVTVTDNNGCTATATITITEPAELILGTTGDIALLCYGDSTATGTFTVSGGTSPYVFVVDANTTGAIMGAPAAIDISFTNGGTGMVVVTVTDANGCTASDTIFVTEPLALVINHVETNVSCNGGNTGSIDITVTGGTTNYTYSWSNGATTEDVGNLSAGTYTVTVTDANNCILDSAITITEPPALVINHVDFDVTCNSGNDGVINITVTGGTGAYTYAWSNGPTSEDVNNLTAGSYTVTVTDANSCTLDSTFTITEPAAWIVTTDITNITCYGDNNGQVTVVNVSGGIVPYTYLWSDGQTGQTATNLSEGDYSVTITDAISCNWIENVTITEPLPIITNPEVTNASCPGVPDGAIILNISGGTAPYSVLWSNGKTTEDLTNVTDGVFNVQITDASMCVKTDSVTVDIIGVNCVPGAEEIQSVITPNGDGKNDVWRIKNIELYYPKARVEIYTRWGKLIFSSTNYHQTPWDGTYNGKELPMDSYHYIIDLGDDSKPRVGNVTIIK